MCDDMFPFVARACAHAKIYAGRAAFYIYEPLWMANLSEAEMDRLYGGMLDAIAKHKEAVIVYCSADAYREMKTTASCSRRVLCSAAPSRSPRTARSTRSAACTTRSSCGR